VIINLCYTKIATINAITNLAMVIMVLVFLTEVISA